jgi:prevent-host-death family protein
MKKMAAGTFKIHCLSIMDEVLAKRETVLITKHGKPVAKLVPPDQTTDDIFGFLASKGKILGDLVNHSEASRCKEIAGNKRSR